MTKIEFRKLISYYGARWQTYRYNRKHIDKKLMLEEKFVLRNVVPGTVMAYNCLGELYNDILPMTNSGPADNLLIINPVSFSYKSVPDIVEQISIALPNVKIKGRVIVNIDLFYVIYDRINISFETLIQQFVSSLETLHLECDSKLFLQKTPQGYGQLFLSLNRV